MLTRDPNAPLPIEGFLPVKVLQHYILGWFEGISPELREQVLEELKYRGLDPGIGYHIEAEPVSDIAEIDPQHKIHIREPYLQFLWCVCYTLITMYEEGVKKPTEINGELYVQLNSKDPAQSKAYLLMDAAMKSVKDFDANRFVGHPQPKDPNHESDPRIDAANNVFVSAGAFILMHEVAHQYFGHVEVQVDDKQSKKDEIEADSYALSFIRRGLETGNKDRDQINALGVIATMTSLILLYPTFEGGNRHPDLDIRYLHALESIGLGDSQDLWIAACLSLMLYNAYNPVNLQFPPARAISSYRDVFYMMLVQVVRQKHPRHLA